MSASAGPSAPEPFQAHDAPCVRFGEVQSIVVPLELVLPQGAHTLSDVTRMLFILRVQIVTVTEEPVRDGVVVWRLRVCAFDGAPLPRGRRRRIVEELRRRLVAPVSGGAAA